MCGQAVHGSMWAEHAESQPGGWPGAERPAVDSGDECPSGEPCRVLVGEPCRVLVGQRGVITV